MQEVYERVWIANDSACRTGNETLAVVHACKAPYHQQAVGYRGSLPNTYPNYLVAEHASDLFLNIIDPPVPLFKSHSFTSFLLFAEANWNNGKQLFIHCNQGESRGPSLVFLFLAKRLFAINGSSYQLAREDFSLIYVWAVKRDHFAYD